MASLTSTTREPHLSLHACVTECSACGDHRWKLNAEGVRDYEYASPGQYRWMQCQNCALIALVPQPSYQVLDLAYPRDYHGYHESTSALVSWYVRRRKRRRARLLASMLPPGGVILDIGCGDGSLLEEVGHQGDFRLLGVEFQPQAAEAARDRGVTVWAGELADARISPGTVDLAIMEHVIEHVRDPAETSSRINYLLRPGGVIVGETPNTDCLDARLSGRYWGGGHAPRHLHLFSPGSLRVALERAGFQKVGITHPVYPAHMALSLQNFMRRGRSDTIGLTRGRAWYFPFACSLAMPFAVLASLSKSSGAMQFIASKPVA